MSYLTRQKKCKELQISDAKYALFVNNWANSSFLFQTNILPTCIKACIYYTHTCSASKFRSSIWNICLKKRDYFSHSLNNSYGNKKATYISIFLKVKNKNRTVLGSHSGKEFSNLSNPYEWCDNWKRPRNDIPNFNWTKDVSSVFRPSCYVQV